MYKDELSVFIPNSFLSESKDLKVRTFKVGILGRALAVFQIDNVVIYNDDHIKNENGEECTFELFSFDALKFIKDSFELVNQLEINSELKLSLKRVFDKPFINNSISDFYFKKQPGK